MRIKFSLRTLLILFTVITIFGGWRYGQRTTLQKAAKRIEQQGAVVFYHWQEPFLVQVPTSVPNAYHTVEIPVSVTRPDGSIVTESVSQTAWRNTGHQILVEVLKTVNSSEPEFQWSGFLLGTHDDVVVEAVSIPRRFG